MFAVTLDKTEDTIVVANYQRTNAGAASASSIGIRMQGQASSIKLSSSHPVLTILDKGKKKAHIRVAMLSLRMSINTVSQFWMPSLQIYTLWKLHDNEDAGQETDGDRIGYCPRDFDKHFRDFICRAIIVNCIRLPLSPLRPFHVDSLYSR